MRGDNQLAEPADAFVFAQTSMKRSQSVIALHDVNVRGSAPKREPYVGAAGFTEQQHAR